MTWIDLESIPDERSLPHFTTDDMSLWIQDHPGLYETESV